jgi:serine phosphatase RsbU (regulator of sigma subunit)
VKKLTLTIALIILYATISYSQDVETQYIGNYIFVLANNVDFPNQYRIPVYKIAVYGNNSSVYKYMLKIYKKKRIHGKPVRIYNISRLRKLKPDYNIIYIDQSKNRLLDNIYNKVKGHGILIITYKNTNQNYIMINLLGINKKFQIQTANLYKEKIIPSENLIAIGGTKVDLQTLYEKKVEALDQQEQEIETKQRKLDSLKIITNKQKLINEEKNSLLAEKEEQLKQKEQSLKRQEKRLKFQGLEIKFQKNIILIIIIFVIILVILSGVIYRSLKINKEINAQLRQKNEEIRQQSEKIADQAKEIEKQRDIAIEKGNELERINKDIKASITYALNIQKALLSSTDIIKKYFDSFFIYYRPRDIVSGDFYWIGEKNNNIYIVAADCTGHGVPGAFMSMLGIAFLNEIIKYPHLEDTNLIIDELREKVIYSLKQSVDDNTGARDGMDLAIIRFDKNSRELQYSGAYNSLYIISDQEPKILQGFTSYRTTQIQSNENKLYEIRADRMPIGVYIKEYEKFTSKKVKLKKDDLMYIFSDGFADMYNEENSSKFGTKRFKELLLNNSELSIDKQIAEIKKAHISWCGENYQIDDILIIGIKV